MSQNKASQNTTAQQKFSQRKLAALDGDDLAVISAHIQDAAVVAGDILWRQAEKRLVVAMRRLDCEDIIAGDCVPRRLISALRFDRVLSCQSREIDMDAPGLPLTLLGLEFHPGKKPGGQVMLLFASGGVLRLEVECLECELADLGPDSLDADLVDGAAAT
ncbi:hypothetical protein HNQ36_002391 [Afipia massiliensis]|uniref:DUF2948 family protein n=1 Tax=Afipia massiliensis TaxID=211460 RepID=A0A840N1M2_9BRAD|nr:DUF2948 family protein [Afipia massiliensis]MBB5052417.1 hypothetical protein [Afipia massiliensis]